MQAGTGKGCGHPWADPHGYTGARSLQDAEIRIWLITTIFGKQKTKQTTKKVLRISSEHCRSGAKRPCSVSSATAEGCPAVKYLEKC